MQRQTAQPAALHSMNSNAVEIASVGFAGMTVVLFSVLAFGENLVAHVLGIWMANLCMLFIVHLGLRRRHQSWVDFGLWLSLPSVRESVKVVLQSIGVFFCAIGAFVAAAIVMGMILGVPQEADTSRYQYLRGNLSGTLLALGSVYFVSSFAEEAIYRGFLINRIEEMFGGKKQRSARFWAIGISSVAFGLVHSDWGVAGMVQATCMGLALGWAYVRIGRSLWVTILAHAYMDTILILQLYFGDR